MNKIHKKIESKRDFEFFLEADRIGLSKKKHSIFNFWFWYYKIKKDNIWEFTKLLRKCEFIYNCKKGILNKFILAFHYRKLAILSLKLGFSIPLNTFGPGLSIAHFGSIVVNGGARIGNNCRLQSGVNIGTKPGYHDKAPIIGNNVYIGPGAKIYGDIIIPSNTIIGANSVVNKSFDKENIAIAGIPAKIVKENIEIEDYITLATEIVKKRIDIDPFGKTNKGINEILNENISS